MIVVNKRMKVEGGRNGGGHYPSGTEWNRDWGEQGRKYSRKRLRMGIAEAEIGLGVVIFPFQCQFEIWISKCSLTVSPNAQRSWVEEGTFIFHPNVLSACGNSVRWGAEGGINNSTMTLNHFISFLTVSALCFIHLLYYTSTLNTYFLYSPLPLAIALS